MSSKKVWFITGAGRGMGVDFAKAARAAGHAVVATGRDRSAVGDPAKLARALITIASQEPPPRRFIAGADAVATAEQVAAGLRAQTEAYRALSSSLALDPEAARAK